MASPPEPPKPCQAAGLVPAPEPNPSLRRRSDYRLVRTLLSLQHSGANGVLRVEAEGVVTIIYLRDGHPVFVEGGLPADSLGRLLVHRGTISETTLAQVEEQRMLMQGRLRFGDVARRMGVLDKDALRAALRDQVGNKLARCLHWEHSQHVFIPEDHDREPLPGDVLAIEPLLLAGVRRHFSQERMRGVLSTFFHDAAELGGDPVRIAKRFALDETQRDDLASIDGVSSIASLLRKRSSRQVAVAHLLVALALTDQLKAPDAVAPEESGPFKVDDVARRVVRVPVRATTTAEAVPARPELREVPALPGKEKLLADSAFLQGKELYRAGEYGAAADAFREASSMRPNALEYALWSAWSAYVSIGRPEKWRDILVALCERTLVQDRHLAFAHNVTGQLSLEVNDLDRAREALSRAVELDPQDDEARRLLSRVLN